MQGQALNKGHLRAARATGIVTPMQEDQPRAPTPSYQRQLDLIAEMSQEFAASRDIGETLQRGLERVAAFVGAEAASLFLLDEDSGDLVCAACCGPVDIRGLRLTPDGTPATNSNVVWRSVRTNTAIILRDPGQDPDFGQKVDDLTDHRTESLVCAPLSVRDLRLGAIELVNKADGGPFHAGDRQLLRALGASAALAIINARLTASLVAQERVRRELELAAEIQRGMLPSRQDPDCPVLGVNVPAHEVSGDFFDILPLANGQIAFAVGDVAGKGINAALLMTRASSLFRCLAKTHRRPAALLAAMNEELCDAGSGRGGLLGGLFVTLAAGLFDPITGMALLANAGHEPPLLLRRDGEMESYPAAAPPLGIGQTLIAADMTEDILFLAGGALYLFTDGLTESRCGAAMLGADGVGRLIQRYHPLPAAPRLDAIIAALLPAGCGCAEAGKTDVSPANSSAVGPRDDLTLLVVEDRRPVPILARSQTLTTASLSPLRLAVDHAARAAGLAESDAADVVLAVDEACQNVLRHGYGGQPGDIHLEIRRLETHNKDQRSESARLEILLIDFAPPADPAKIEPRNLDDLRPGGLGTHFMRAVMDEVAFLPPPEGAGNLLRMSKAIPCP